MRTRRYKYFKDITLDRIITYKTITYRRNTIINFNRYLKYEVHRMNPNAPYKKNKKKGKR